MTDESLMTRFWRWLEARDGLPILHVFLGITSLAILAGLLWNARVLVGLYQFGETGAHLRGTPPYMTECETRRAQSGSEKPCPLNLLEKVAMVKFPDVQACLDGDADPETLEGLRQIDWDLIRTEVDAEVCVFRLLAASGIAAATVWFEHQGFYVLASASSVTPYVYPDGTLRVTGRRSVAGGNHLYPRYGIFDWVLPDASYSQSISGRWSPDGETLLFVDMGYLVK